MRVDCIGALFSFRSPLSYSDDLSPESCRRYSDHDSSGRCVNWADESFQPSFLCWRSTQHKSSPKLGETAGQRAPGTLSKAFV